MSTEPIVSVIIIFRNEERFLRDAIESVLAQSYTNWELLLVDDASTDKGTEIAKGYQKQLPEKVHYLTHPNFENRGMSASRRSMRSSTRQSYSEPWPLPSWSESWTRCRLSRSTGKTRRGSGAGRGTSPEPSTCRCRGRSIRSRVPS